MTQPVKTTKFQRKEKLDIVRRNIILDAAGRVFGRRGFHDTRIDELAEEAGFSKAALYRYFHDKEEIFLNLAIREYEKVIQLIEETIHPTEPFISNLETITRTVFSGIGDHFSILLATSSYQATHLLRCQIHRHEDLMRQFLSLITRINAKMESLIRAAQKQGEIRCSLNPDILAGYVTSLVKGVLFKWKTSGRREQIDVAVSDLITFISHGLSISPGDAQ